MKLYLIVVIFSLFTLLLGCKENLMNDEEDFLWQPIADSVAALNINDISVRMDKYGDLLTTNWMSFPALGEFISVAGLWIAAEQDEIIRGNIVTNGSHTSRYSNYTSVFNKRQYGVYRMDPSTNFSSINWPAEFGAPVTASGKPKVYGDMMCCQILFSDTTITSSTLLAGPIRGLCVSQTIYGYKRSDLRYVFFIRYTITNTTKRNWNNVYVGFYSDTDLLDSGFDKTCFDSLKSICYTYSNYNYANGFTFLESPKNLGITSSRIMRKNNYINPEFGETSCTWPVHILYTLQGRSNFGLPMINPVTKKETKFAFTGDPISGTGWLDSPIDTRNIIACGPFTLNGGETTTVTVAWVSANGNSLLESINNMKDKIEYIRQNSSLWKF